MRDEPSVLHLDADAFFAAVEQRQRPSLRGRPVIVGGLGPRGRGDRQLRGPPLRRGLGDADGPGAHAVPGRLLPDPPLRRLQRAQRRPDGAAAGGEPAGAADQPGRGVRRPGRRSAPNADPLATADYIRREFWRRTGLVVSIGLGRSKLIAKLASEAGKPHGWTVITAEQEDDFLLPTPVGKLWGVGPATEAVLHGIGVRTVAQLRETPQADLVRLLGVAHGNGLHRLAFGLDERPVETDRETKSISAERTFALTSPDARRTRAELDVVFGHARRRLDAPRRRRPHGHGEGPLQRLHDGHPRGLAAPADHRSPGAAGRRGQALAAAAPTGEPLRLLGVGFSGLTDHDQLTLGLDEPPADVDLTEPESQPEPAGDDAELPTPLLRGPRPPRGRHLRARARCRLDRQRLRPAIDGADRRS